MKFMEFYRVLNINFEILSFIIFFIIIFYEIFIYREYLLSTQNYLLGASAQPHKLFTSQYLRYDDSLFLS